jgi:hypothetical protein
VPAKGGGIAERGRGIQEATRALPVVAVVRTVPEAEAAGAVPPAASHCTQERQEVQCAVRQRAREHPARSVIKKRDRDLRARVAGLHRCHAQ